MVAAVLVEAVDGLAEEDLVEDSEALRVAGADAEYDEVLTFLADIPDLDILAVNFELGEVLGLREEEILCTADGIELLCELHAALVLPVLGSARLTVGGDIEGLLGSDVIEQLIELSL